MGEQTLQQCEAQLAQNLARLIAEGDSSSFLVVEAGPVYIQFAVGRGKKEVYCEAVSNQFLPADLRLSDDQVAQLRRLGFQEPGASPNFSRTFSLAEEAEIHELAHLTCQILSSIYNCHSQSPVRFELALE